MLKRFFAVLMIVFAVFSANSVSFAADADNKMPEGVSKVLEEFREDIASKDAEAEAKLPFRFIGESLAVQSVPAAEAMLDPKLLERAEGCSETGQKVCKTGSKEVPYIVTVEKANESGESMDKESYGISMRGDTVDFIKLPLGTMGEPFMSGEEEYAILKSGDTPGGHLLNLTTRSIVASSTKFDLETYTTFGTLVVMAVSQGSMRVYHNGNSYYSDGIYGLGGIKQKVVCTPKIELAAEALFEATDSQLGVDLDKIDNSLTHHSPKAISLEECSMAEWKKADVSMIITQPVRRAVKPIPILP